jgi:hypothetical protein
MLWSRRATPTHDKARHAGVDLTSSRARAVSVGVGKTRTLLLDDPSEDLPLFVALDRRAAEVGRAGYTICRKTPHAACSNFLPALGQPREWRNGRHTLTPESALELALAKARGLVAAESEAAVLALPAYLAPVQVSKIVAVANRVKLPLKGTAVGPLALVADRACFLLVGKPVSPEATPPEWVVPIRPNAGGPGAVAVVDADEYAVSATIIAVDRDRVRLVALGCWPRFAVKLWKDRLLDAVSDRCVRLCRRDPRDSADAEQALFEQLDDALDRVRAGQRVNLTVRTDHWFQDVVQQPEEFEAHCANLSRGAGEALRELVENAGLALPPFAVWLTHDAGRLPGLARSVHQNTPEGTAVEVLSQNAVAEAAAALAPRWLAAELPRAHLDATIPIMEPGVGNPESAKKTAAPRPAR